MNLKVNTGVVVLRQVKKGARCALYAMGDGHACALQEFLLQARQDHNHEFAKIMALMEYVAENGPPRNEQKCRFFPGTKLFELKTRGGIRVMAFWDENQLIICTHGFVKKQQKTPTRELARAVAAQDRYFQAKQMTAIRFEENAP